MKPIDQYKQAYFLGIGGIGMSAICRYLKEINMRVAGYDKTPTQLTGELVKLGIEVTYDESVGSLPQLITNNLEETLFIITPAIPQNHPQKVWLESKRVALFKRSEILGLITQNTICLAVAGTHGKTTTSTLLAHVLRELDWDFSAFLGGISSNFGTNYIHHTSEKKYNNSHITVVEADEFDRSFHRLYPDAAIITAIDADHLDIYQTKEAFEEAFHVFAKQVKKSQQPHLFVNSQLNWPNTGNHFYGYDKHADYQLLHVEIKDGAYLFSVKHKNQEYKFKAGLPGYHNVLNACATIALCHGYLGISMEDLIQPISNFKGVRRRFEYLKNCNSGIVIDDYAHHPEELNMIINSVKHLYPDSEITGIFQPHLFSRTKDFAQEFAIALDQLDTPILLEIYPAREQPIPGITSNYLKSIMTSKNAEVLSKEEVLNVLKANKPKVLLILGAGDIDTLREPIMEIYE